MIYLTRTLTLLPVMLLLGGGLWRPSPDREPKPAQVLLEALDAGLADTVQALFATSPTLFILDGRDQPIRADGARAVEQLVATWQTAKGTAGPSELVSSTLVSTSADSQIYAFEFERRGDQARRYRGTLCAELRGEIDEQVQKIVHLHISIADREDY